MYDRPKRYYVELVFWRGEIEECSEPEQVLFGDYDSLRAARAQCTKQRNKDVEAYVYERRNIRWDPEIRSWDWDSEVDDA